MNDDLKALLLAPILAFVLVTVPIWLPVVEKLHQFKERRA